MVIYEKIKNLYPDREIPGSHAAEIKKQMEGKLKNYDIKEEEIEVALALVKHKGFKKEEKDKKTDYTAEIIYHKDKEKHLLHYKKFKEHNKDWYQMEFNFCFHYTPYNFDSNPEKDFFEQLLMILNEKPADIEDIYYTGAIYNPDRTDFIFEYKGKDGRWHNYTPDFLIKRENGKMVIVEIKAPQFRDEAKEKALKEIEGLNPDRLK